MGRGLGARQLQVLDRLRQIRCAPYPVLWHAVLGDPAKPWPDPEYGGHRASDIGHPLCLYASDTSRSVQVAYRRAASVLASRGLVETMRTRLSMATSDLLYVRLVPTPGELHAAARANEKYWQSFEDLYSLDHRYRYGEEPPVVKAMLRTKIDRITRWMNSFERVDASRNPSALGD